MFVFVSAMPNPSLLPPKHPNEELRLAALHSCGILDTPYEEAFDDITRLIAEICDAPIAVVNLIDRDRQWFKSEVGLGVRETPLPISICAHAILQPDVFIVPDTLSDERFAQNPLVLGDPRLRFYAGALLQTQTGEPIGTLCVLDTVPRNLSPKQVNALRVLARETMTQIELRQRVREQEVLIAEREAARTELVRVSDGHKRVAEVLQRSLLLAPPVGAFPGVEVAHFYEAASDEALVGGDFYDVFALRGNRVALVVGDVTGKGLGAAAYTAEAKFVLRSLLRDGANPAEALHRLNHSVLEAKALDVGESTDAGGTKESDNVFVALLVAVVSTETGSAVIASAGAEPPLILRKVAGVGTPFAENFAEEVETSGLFIGADADAEYTSIERTLGAGDTLLLFSDGIPEARKRPDFFGAEGIINAALAEYGKAGGALPGVDVLARAVLDAAHTWTGGKLHDDVCLVAVRFMPKKQARL